LHELVVDDGLSPFDGDPDRDPERRERGRALQAPLRSRAPRGDDLGEERGRDQDGGDHTCTRGALEAHPKSYEPAANALPR